jgi:hypothetical protein
VVSFQVLRELTIECSHMAESLSGRRKCSNEMETGWLAHRVNIVHPEALLDKIVGILLGQG